VYDLKVVVEEVKGFCDMPLKDGDYFEVKGGKLFIPDGKYMCIWALQSILPMLPLKQRKIDEDNDWVSHTHRLSCPDPNGMVIFRVDRYDPVTRKKIENPEEKKSPPPRIIVNEELCTGCRACETICSFVHNGSFNGEKARIKIEKLEGEGIDRPHVCRQCGDAPCVKECPTRALSRDPISRAIIVDESKCIGCKQCASVCPFGAISFTADFKVPMICDLCQGEPECVKRCPSGAIQFGNAEEINRLGE
jgi:anaerobic carbon-monoxide dehydrogenase iron sulfur subunit